MVPFFLPKRRCPFSLISCFIEKGVPQSSVLGSLHFLRIGLLLFLDLLQWAELSHIWSFKRKCYHLIVLSKLWRNCNEYSIAGPQIEETININSSMNLASPVETLPDVKPPIVEVEEDKLDTRFFGELLAEVYRKNTDIHTYISDNVAKIRGRCVWSSACFHFRCYFIYDLPRHHLYSWNIKHMNLIQSVRQPQSFTVTRIALNTKTKPQIVSDGSDIYFTYLFSSKLHSDSHKLYDCYPWGIIQLFPVTS